ncbi:MAG: sugar ABC transporter permease [Chloroflexota bacterium]|nr:sugar ABC transporter permease [Chloroflexota bacterium]
MAGLRGVNKYFWVGLFLLPSLIGLMVFTISPILSSLWYSLHDWNLLSPPEWIGIGNYTELFNDPHFWAALRTTAVIISLYLPSAFLLGLALALFLNTRVRGMVLVRTATFLPVVASWVVVSLIWKWLFNPQYGLINIALGAVGIEGPAWLFQPESAIVALVITSIWKDVGYIALIYLGGLQAISPTYYEAAQIDGANRWQLLRRITLPLLSPTMFFIVITLLINYFQVFEQIYLMPMRDSAADRQIEVIVTEVVKNAFMYNRMGYASALSWVLFGIIFAITFLQFRLQKRWVYDEGV